MQTIKCFVCLSFLLLVNSQGQHLSVKPSSFYEYLLSSLSRGAYVDDGSYLRSPYSYDQHPWIANEHLPFPYYGNAHHQDVVPPVANGLAQFRLGFKKTSGQQESPSGRFGLGVPDNVGFNGGSNVYANPFVKTAYFYTTSVVTDTAVVRCVPASQFANAAAQNGACRRRRDAAVLDEMYDAEHGIAPSPTLTVEKSAEPVGVNEPKMIVASISPGSGEIRSSKEIAFDADDSRRSESGPVRDKRFFYVFRSYLTVPTTVTNYSFTTTTYTATLLLANAAQMTCLPIGYVVC